MQMYILGWLLALAALASGQTAEQFAYKQLNINLKAQDSSKLVLKETYAHDRSRYSEYKRKYMFAREEYDPAGRPSLYLFYDTEAEMAAKVIHFYPQKGVEKSVFQQKNGAVDSVTCFFDQAGNKTAEFWAWGDDCSRDSILYRYNDEGRLVALRFDYLGRIKRDTLIYKNGLLDKLLTFNHKDELQQEVEFFYLDSLLLKISLRNNKRLITEEEFFFYNERGQIRQTISKIYLEQENSLSSPYRRRQNSYHPNGQLKKSVSSSYDPKRKKIGYTESRYDRAGRLVYEREYNRSAGIDKTIYCQYNAKK